MYFLIGIWGHERRIYAAVKFFLYTFAGSVLMLTAIIYVYNHAGTFDYPDILSQLASGRLAFNPLAADAAVPGVLRRVRREGSDIPAAHLVAGRARGSAHGRLGDAGVRDAEDGHLRPGRFCLPMFPSAGAPAPRGSPVLAIIGIVYGALVAMVQPNMKKLVAYSSVSHLGFVVLGIFSFTQNGIDGAVYQMLNHGISTGALFMLVGFLYERRHSLAIADYGGVATPAPWLSTRVHDHHAGQYRTADAEQFRGRVSGAAGLRAGQFHCDRLRLDRRDSLGVLHAVAVPARVLRRD
jgi:NADH-quinone oxidoreductase subunit M